MRAPWELKPEPDEARSWFRRELLNPDYQRENPIQRLVRWIQRTLERSVETVGSLPVAGQLAAMVVGLALVLAIGWLVSRGRRTRRSGEAPGRVLTDERVGAAELRRRAELALAGGRFGDAVIDGFRALTVRQVELAALPDMPEATAHEVSLALAAQHPDLADHVSACARNFDLVLYGDRPAQRAQAEAVLALDDRLAGVRR